jgi:pimeloyl-ACP methyl ester carboxylesterase
MLVYKQGGSMVILMGRCRMFKRYYVTGLLGVFLTVIGSFSVAHATVALADVPVKPAKVVLLLHGMNSDLTTWNKLVANNAGFDGSCGNTKAPDFLKAPIQPNSEGVYCMRFNFGGFDRTATAPKGLDKKICSEVGGCKGDYSTFESLGREVASAIGRIRARLGAQVQIVLLGHSRGGLAARVLLQGTEPFKNNVVGLITTGTPHAGTPLGRYYDYMAKSCLPESRYSGFFDFRDCADDWDFVNQIKNLGSLDLKAPTIGFLSEVSLAINALNTKVSAVPNIQITQLSYNDIKFGCLRGDLPPLNSEKGCGYDIFGKIIRYKPSSVGLNAVLNGRARDALKGDGIVPITSQKMTKLNAWKPPVKDYSKLSRVHVVETGQIFDLTTALANMYQRLGWR